jgi:3-phytase
MLYRGATCDAEIRPHRSIFDHMLRHRTARTALLLAMAGIAAIAATALVLRDNPSRQSVGRGADGVTRGPASTAQRFPATLRPAAETEPVPHGGDAADDPAIWVNRRHRAQSTIIGTDKKGGLAVYDLSGRQLQYLPGGQPNNVDLRAGFPLGSRHVALVAASDRSDDTVALYRIDDRTRRLTAVASFKAGIDNVYGLCMYRSRRSGAFYVFVDSEQGELEQWQLQPRGRAVSARRVRSFDVGGQVEGCVADDALGALYIGEEDRGIWKYGAEPSAGTRRSLVDSTGGDGHLSADVEGITLAEGRDGTGLLIASSQGDSTFAVYRREGDNGFLRTFTIGPANGIDEVTQTDGIDATTANLGPRYPRGLFVAQDGRNDNGNQSFKLVPMP